MHGGMRGQDVTPEFCTHAERFLLYIGIQILPAQSALKFYHFRMNNQWGRLFVNT